MAILRHDSIGPSVRADSSGEKFADQPTATSSHPSQSTGERQRRRAIRKQNLLVIINSLDPRWALQYFQLVLAIIILTRI